MQAKSAVSSSTIGVLIADSNQIQSQLLVNALRRRPEFRVSSCEMDAESILDLAASTSIQVAIINAERKGSGSQDMTILRRLHLASPQIAKILLIDVYDRDLVIMAFRSGAKGLFCFSEYPFRLLCKCITSVHEGQVWANNEQLLYLLDGLTQVSSLRMVNSQGAKLLTPREEQVVALVAEGLSNREVARELNLSEHTVKKYVFRIFDFEPG
jgi:DNA-binding NarL/FixJ family response regulator